MLDKVHQEHQIALKRVMKSVMAQHFVERTSTKSTQPKHNDKEDTMSTFTAAQLEEKINPPVAEPVQGPHKRVIDLEQANQNAALEVQSIVIVAGGADYLSGGHGTHGVRIPEKYQKRLAGILRDMRKDQEAILNETAAKLAKVQKVLG